MKKEKMRTSDVKELIRLLKLATKAYPTSVSPTHSLSMVTSLERMVLPSPLVVVQLETCHANTDGSAWYAYFDREPTLQDKLDCLNDKSKVEDGGCLGAELEPDSFEFVPNIMSKALGLYRYYVGAAG
jgi:hypothetical protein